MSNGLVKMGNAAKETYKHVQNQMAETAKKNDTLSKSFSALGKEIEKTENLLKSSTSKNEIAKTAAQLAELKKTAAQHFANPENGGKANTSSGGGGILGAIAGLFSKSNMTALGSLMVSGAMKQQQDVASLQPFLKDGAQGAYANIKKDAAATPFDTDSLLAVNKSLVSAGANAKDARLDTLALANAFALVGGGNEDLTKMADLMGQVKDAGRASSADLKKFSDAGIDVYGALSNATGKSAKELKKMSISYEGLSYALRKAGADGGAFAGAMDTQNQTVSAKWANFTEGLKTGLGDVGLSFMPLIGRLLDFANTLTTTLLPQIMQFVQPIMDMLNSLPIETILNNVLSVVSAILAAVSPIITELQPLFDTLFETLTPLIAQVSAFIVSLVQQLAPILAAIARIVAVVLAPAIKFAGEIVSTLITDIKNAVDAIMPFIQELVGWIESFINKVVSLLGLKDDNAKQTLSASAIKGPGASNTSISAVQAASTKGLAELTNNLNKPKDMGLQADKTAGAITSGGPRVININGVKFTDKIEMHVLNAKEGLNDLEIMLEEMFLRILNSGAVIV